jgi:hypothetical protein
VTHVDKVEALIQAGIAGMETIEDTSPGDIASACLTLCRRTIAVVMSIDPSYREGIREAVELLLMDTADRSKAN